MERAETTMRRITFDDKSVMLNGQRIQLVSGAVHYFRMPREQWRDRLEKCRQGGLNTIETYVAWNLHEYHEGRFNFNGDADLGTFLDLCHEYGFYTIVRPSPYICAEWDNGGLPAWLSQKEGIAYRCMNGPYIAAVARWYDQLIPIIAKRQWTRGGSVILVQIENEYGYFDSVQDMKYMEFLRDALLERGIEVPLVTCDSPGVGQKVEGAVKCANFGSNFRRGLAVLREEQPNAYLFVSELWLAWFDHWGGSHQTRSGREVANALKEVLAAGGHYNFYMWCGGTNFAFFAGRTTTGDYGAFNTTSYDYDAPIGETGNLTQKYSECRLVNWMAQSFQELFAGSSEVASPSIQSSNPLIEVTERVSAAGRAIFLSNHSSVPQSTPLSPILNPVTVTSGLGADTDGGPLQRANLPTELGYGSVWVEPHDTKVLLADVRLSEDASLIFTTLETLAKVRTDNRTVLLLYGDPLEDFHVVIGQGNQKHSLVSRIPDDMTPNTYTIANVDIVILNRRTAYVTWIGTKHGQPAWWIDERYAIRSGVVDLTDLVWERADVIDWLETTNGLDRSFREHGFPRHLEAYGVLHGYGWYTTEFDHEGGASSLVMSHVRDRALVYVNGQYAGTIGSLSQFARLPITCLPGKNRLRILAEGLGRYNFTSRLGEKKGVYGPVYIGGEDLQVPAWTVISNRLELQLDVPEDHSALIRLSELSDPVRVFVNNKLIYTYRGTRVDDEFVELNLGAFIGLPHGSVVITIEFAAGTGIRQSPKLKAVSYALNQPLNEDWVIGAGVVGEGTEIVMDMSVFESLTWVNSDDETEMGLPRPTLFRSRFHMNDEVFVSGTIPLKIRLDGLTKGVVWLNGRNLGRHWSIGPQTALYVPTEWLRRENEVVIFDEWGACPSQARFIQAETFL